MPASQITKRALEESLKRLLLEKPLPKITIADLTEDCGISRMTFYYHFRDIYDLVEWSCEEDAAAALAGNKTAETWQVGLVRLMEAVRDNRPLIMNVYRSVSRERVERFLVPAVHDLVRGVVEEHASGCRVREGDKDFLSDFLAHALVGTILDWIADGMREEPGELASRVACACDGQVAAALGRFEARAGRY